MNKLLTDNDLRRKRLRYRSWHRGWKETDIILGQFADENIDKLDDEQLDAYEQLLDENDADIWDWLVGKLPPTKSIYAPILEALQAYGQHKG